MRLTQTNAAIKEERVIAVLQIVGDLPGSCTSKLVGFTLNKILKGKTAIQVTGVLDQIITGLLVTIRRCAILFIGFSERGAAAGAV